MAEMTYYHGSSARFAAFETPTGAEAWDVTKGGVVYLTTDRELAEGYAQGGYVYTVSAPGARSYADQRRRQGLPAKKGKYVRGVYVALPSDCEIRRVERV